ncbi:Uncharacterised protein [Legionella busanensis]|uniref:Uncharacterized protein n=1 Tax=Legionella busanensis TaxID=190655 RepID=A0A378KDL2_9GAMM|nr:hypothetical protein [Legionella busanensis]STX81611.1 Uncharacterised protein [Legionella busanensis]
MFYTLDSNPQENLEFKPNSYHTMCFCCFRDKEHALSWIKKLIPQNRCQVFHKWSSESVRGRRKQKVRETFIENINKNIHDIDFKVYCISSTESDISFITQGFYSSNLNNISQEKNDNGKNYLVFKITQNNNIKIPALRAARLIWAFEGLRMLNSMFEFEGKILSDWFASDSYDTAVPVTGVSLVNFLLSNIGIKIQLEIPNDPKNEIFELMSDWFSGWCRTYMEKSEPFGSKYEKLIEKAPEKFIHLILNPPYNPITYGQHCLLMEFNTTTNTLRLVY